MTIPRELQHILSCDPEVLGGQICFTDTRIPLYILWDNLEGGTPWDEFYDSYPDLNPDMVLPIIAWENRQAKQALGLEAAA